MSVYRGMDPWDMVFNLQEKRIQTIRFIILETDCEMYRDGDPR